MTREDVIKSFDKAVDKFILQMTSIAVETAVKGHLQGQIKAIHKIQQAINDKKAVGNKIQITNAGELAVDWNQVDEAAVMYGKEYGKKLIETGKITVNQVAADGTFKVVEVDWLPVMNSSTRADVNSIIQRGIAQGLPTGVVERKKGGYTKGTIADELSKYFGGWKSRASTIARTEVARHQFVGSMARYQHYGVEKLLWLCGPNPCLLCGPLHNQVFSIDKVPFCPIHPCCECDVAPYFDKAEEGDDEIVKSSISDFTTEQSAKIYREDWSSIQKYDVKTLPLDGTEKGALYGYQSSNYRSINNMLRHPSADNEKSYMWKKVELLKSAFKNEKTVISDPIVVYRGIDASTAKSVIAAKQYVDPAFVSTSTRFMTAHEFSTIGDDGYRTILRCAVSPGNRGIALQGEDESELLLNAGQRMKVVSIEEVTNRKIRILNMVAEGTS